VAVAGWVATVWVVLVEGPATPDGGGGLLQGVEKEALLLRRVQNREARADRVA